MNALSMIVLITLVMFASGLIAAYVSHLKNRDVSYWAAWGFLFPPSLIVLIMLGTHQGQRPRRPTLDEEDRLQL